MQRRWGPENLRSNVHHGRAETMRARKPAPPGGCTCALILTPIGFLRREWASICHRPLLECVTNRRGADHEYKDAQRKMRSRDRRGGGAESMSASSGTETLRKPRLPADRCIFCGRTIEQVGGRRLIGTHTKLVTLSRRAMGGGHPHHPDISVRLRTGEDLFLLVRGPDWTPQRIEDARDQFLAGRHAWFCQVCGDRKCRRCGSPLNMPWAADVLYDDGCSAHVPLVPFDPGCINRSCLQYREWNATPS